MSKTIKVALASAGAFGIKHLDAIRQIEGVQVVSLISRELAKTQEVAGRCGNPHVTANLDDSLALKEVDVSLVDLSMNGIELQDRESFAAIREGRRQLASG